jgi:hypothetical protein
MGAPKANATAERFVRTVRSECLDWLLIVNRRHLERVLRVFVARYNSHRPHRALNLAPPDPAANPAPTDICRRAPRSPRRPHQRIQPGRVTDFTYLYGGGRRVKLRWWTCARASTLIRRSVARTYMGARGCGAGGLVGVPAAAHSPTGAGLSARCIGSSPQAVSDRLGLGRSHQELLGFRLLRLRAGRGSCDGRSCARP